MARRKKKTKNKKRNATHSIFTRYMLIVAVFIFWIAAIGVRLVHLQVNQYEWLREQALDQRSYEHKSKMLRGTIFDRSERALAMSIKVKSLYADPSEITDIVTTAERISYVLDLDKKKLIKEIRQNKEKNRRFMWIARKLDKDDFQKVNKTLIDSDLKKYDLPKFAGLHWKEEQKRSYPYKTLAAHIVGFTNSEHKGRAGIEMSQEKILKGEIISKLRERDRLGRVYEEVKEQQEPPKDVVLTISNSIQYKTEEALAKGAKLTNSRSGKAIVLDPKTGEILAMANYPTFDPNEYRKLESAMWKNRVIQDNYSPGSIFKLVTYGAALEENLIQPENQIDCGNGTITVAGHTFTDSHSVGKVSYVKAFAKSSNVGAIKTGLKVGENTFYKYAREFGFGQKTGIDLPAEASGILRSPKNWNGDSLASMSIGYEIGVTALQSAVAFATIANDGVRVQPHIVKEIRQSDGKLVSTNEPKAERIVSEETARSLREMMREVVLDGTAKKAKLKGYTSAGKTGTAWKYDPKIKAVNRNKYVSSFIGFAPADNPKVVIAVVMDEPKSGGRSGGHVAAPVFKEIAEQILPELNVTPDADFSEDSGQENKETPIEEEKNEVVEITVAKKGEKSKEKNTLNKKGGKKEKVAANKKKKNRKKKKSEQKQKEKITTADRKKVKRKKTGARKDRKT